MVNVKPEGAEMWDGPPSSAVTSVEFAKADLTGTKPISAETNLRNGLVGRGCATARSSLERKPTSKRSSPESNDQSGSKVANAFFLLFANPFEIGFGFPLSGITVFADILHRLALACRIEINHETSPIRRANDPPASESWSSKVARTRLAPTEGTSLRSLPILFERIANPLCLLRGPALNPACIVYR